MSVSATCVGAGVRMKDSVDFLWNSSPIDGSSNLRFTLLRILLRNAEMECGTRIENYFCRLNPRSKVLLNQVLEICEFFRDICCSEEFRGAGAASCTFCPSGCPFDGVYYLFPATKQYDPFSHICFVVSIAHRSKFKSPFHTWRIRDCTWTFSNFAQGGADWY